MVAGMGLHLNRGQNIEPPGDVFCVSGDLIAFRYPLPIRFEEIVLWSPLSICLVKRAVWIPTQTSPLWTISSPFYRSRGVAICMVWSVTFSLRKISKGKCDPKKGYLCWRAVRKGHLEFTKMGPIRGRTDKSFPADFKTSNYPKEFISWEKIIHLSKC